MSGLGIERIGLDEANAFVAAHHRHHHPVVGHVFSIGAALAGRIVGIARRGLGSIGIPTQDKLLFEREIAS